MDRILKVYNFSLTMNVTMDNNSTDIYFINIPYHEGYFIVFIKAVIMGSVSLWTLIGNSMVFISLAWNSNIRTMPNILIANLAISDLLLAVTVLPIATFYYVLGYWIFGKIICNAWLSIDVLCCTASIWSISAIGLDRYWAITSPTEYINKRTPKRAVIMILIVWILSSIISLPPLIGWNSSPNINNYRWDNYTQSFQCILFETPGYIYYSATGSFIIPLVVMVFVYTSIFRAYKARIKAKRLRSLAIATTLQDNDRRYSTKPSLSNSDSDLSNKKENEESKRNRVLYVETEFTSNVPRKSLIPRLSIVSPRNEKQILNLKERRGEKILGAIVGCFVVCWTPFFIMYIIRGACAGTCIVEARLAAFIIWLGYANSALNPIIYTVFNRDFRLAFKKIIVCKCKTNLSKQSN